MATKISKTGLKILEAVKRGGRASSVPGYSNVIFRGLINQGLIDYDNNCLSVKGEGAWNAAQND